MALVVNLSRRRTVEQLLGVVPRSIGYLQGGYKDTTGRYSNTQHALCQNLHFLIAQ